jgi:hypothetical protein
MLKKKNISWFLFFFIMGLYLFISFEYLFIWNYSANVLVMSITSIFLPLLITTISINKDSIMQGLLRFLKFYNPLVIISLILAVIDYITGSKIQFYLADISDNNEFSELIILEHNYYNVYRYYSFLGHPLTNATYFLIFIILNNIYGKFKKYIINKYLIILIGLTGLLLSGSKTGIVLGILAIILMFDTKKNKFILLFFLVIGILFYFSPLFQHNLLVRFVEGVETGDITTGRNTLLKDLIEYGKEKPALFIGGGVNYSRKVAMNLEGDIHNFEYPFIMLAYDYGIVITVLIYLIIFIIPLVRIIYNKKYFIAINFLIIFIMFNNNNGIANLGSDSLAQLCFLIFLCNNLTKRDAYGGWRNASMLSLGVQSQRSRASSS